MRLGNRLAGTIVGLTLAGGSLVVMAVPASATACAPYGPNSCTTTTVHSPVISADTSVPAPAVAASASSSSSDGLAFTGADVAVTSTVGAGAVAVGGLLVLASRRRRANVDSDS